MTIFCEICGASTSDKEEIAKIKNNICPICLSIGSLNIKKGGAE